MHNNRPSDQAVLWVSEDNNRPSDQVVLWVSEDVM